MMMNSGGSGEGVVVVEVGGRHTRAGWASAMQPDYVVPSWEDPQGDEQVVRPVENGHVANWDAFEELLGKAVQRTRGRAAIRSESDGDSTAAPQMPPLLLVDSPNLEEKDRERACQIVMEKLGAPSYFALNDLVASVYSAGRISSYTFDMGYDKCHIGAVHDGFLFPQTLETIHVGGRHVTQCFQQLMEERSVMLDLKAAETAKIRHARVAVDFAREAASLWSLPANHTEGFTTPDGTTISIADTGIRAAEALFQPMLAGQPGLGLGDALADMTNACLHDRDFPPLQSLPFFFLGTGGSSQLRGLDERIYAELMSNVATVSATKPLFISALQDAPDRQHAAWIGGSIVASLPRFMDNNFVTRAEYDEIGPSAVHRHC